MRPIEAASDGGDADAAARLPGELVDGVAAKIVEDAVGRSWDGLVEDPVREDRFSAVIVDDRERLKTSVDVHTASNLDLIRSNLVSASPVDLRGES
jgi:hypothetical protein